MSTGTRFIVVMVLSLPAVFPAGARPAAESPSWVGQGRYRLLVKLEPVDLGDRASDEMPARLDITAERLRELAGAAALIDAASIQVARYDPKTGKPIPYEKWAYGQADWEVPFRWYDATIPEEFPEFAGNIDSTNGKLVYTKHRGWGYLYETLGDWKSGHLAWVHTQHGPSASHYAIYFDALPEGKTPDTVPRRGFLGDGMERVTEIGSSTHGLRNTRIEAVDWNGDGLIDVIVGGERGGLVWFPNCGTKKQPRFPFPKMVFMADGRPLDVGFSTTPLVIDWDGDGVRDLLSGGEWNRAVWYRNQGTDVAPKLEYRGFILADGKPFSIPHEPNPEIKGIYTRDYHPVLAAVDWDADGDADLLAGGYVTGMIFRFENTGRGDDGLPVLKFRGPVEADGKPVDTQWSAAPCVADFDDDGDFDLISGSMAMTKEGGDAASSENYLYYFENVGTASGPKFTRRPFPIQGKFHVGALAAPRDADLNDDGLLDLVVGQGVQIYIFMNVGKPNAPLWKYDPRYVEGRWNTAVTWGQPIDWNDDGHFDLVSGFSVLINDAKGNPQLFGRTESILPSDERIFHKSPRGDQWTFTFVVDLDGDRRLDVLYGVHEGHVYFHRNLSAADGKHFDTAGVLLKTADGKPIKVGPQPGRKWDFDVLQGARTTVTAADYDRDGKTDLVLGDTFGKVRYYRNASGGPAPTFEPGAEIADVKARLVPATADWNGDGWPDVFAGSAAGVHLALNSGKADGPRFGPAKKMDVPAVPFGSTVMAMDWNEDGDVDLLNRASYGYLCWYDGSFLKRGYGRAKLEKAEARP